MQWILISGIASFLTALQLLPQTIKALRTKNLKGVSLATFSLTSINAFLWVLYGFHLHDVAIIFANFIAFLFAITIVSLKLKK
ncbi:MAG: SemiSWEET family sugar transporter [Candidatus Levyibacteriota bacterium]